MKSSWFFSPTIDLAFMLPFVWLIPGLFIFFYLSSPGEQFQLVTGITALLSLGHLASPVILIWKDKSVREHVARQRPFYNYELALAVGLPLALTMAGWFLFQLDSSTQSFYVPIAIATGLFHIVNTFHFSKQYFGITCFYLPRKARETNKLLMPAIWIVTLVIPLLTWYFHNMRVDFITFYTTRLPMPVWFQAGTMTIITLFIAGLLVKAWREFYLTIPLALSYLSFALISLLICYAPLFFTLTLSSASHWIQAIFLTAVQTSKSPDLNNSTNSSSGRNQFIPKWLIHFFGIVALSVLLFFTVKIPATNITTINLFGKIDGTTQNLRLLSFLILGVLLALSNVHFYLERYIYRRNPIIRLLKSEK